MYPIFFVPKYNWPTTTIGIAILSIFIGLLVFIGFEPSEVGGWVFVGFIFLFLFCAFHLPRFYEIEFSDVITVRFPLRREKVYAYSEVRQIHENYIRMKKGHFYLRNGYQMDISNRDELLRIFHALLETGVITQDQLITEEELRLERQKGLQDVAIITALAVPIWLVLLISGVLPQNDTTFPILSLIWLAFSPFVIFIRRKQEKES